MGCEDNCTCEKRKETWEQLEGKWICKAEMCKQYLDGGGCKLGKISLTCDNNNCKWNKKVEGYGIYVCICMDVHLDADGKCLGSKQK